MKQEFLEDLQKEMLYTLSDNLIIMSTSLVSSIILESRKTSFNED